MKAWKHIECGTPVESRLWASDSDQDYYLAYCPDCNCGVQMQDMQHGEVVVGDVFTAAMFRELTLLERLILELGHVVASDEETVKLERHLFLDVIRDGMDVSDYETLSLIQMVGGLPALDKLANALMQFHYVSCGLEAACVVFTRNKASQFTAASAAIIPVSGAPHWSPNWGLTKEPWVHALKQLIMSVLESLRVEEELTQRIVIP